MQKRARFRFAHKAVNIRILIALQVLLTAAGYYLCAGKAISEPPVIRMTATAGITKITSRNGDNEFVSNGGFHITMKHRANHRKSEANRCRFPEREYERLFFRGHEEKYT